MRSFLPAGLMALCTLLLLQCSKVNDAAPNVVLTARAEHNTSNYGLYKGVFVGSTGIILISLRNENDNILATIRIDGRLYQFTTIGTLEANKPTELLFKSGNSYFTFSVDADGGNAAISGIHMEGHPDAGIILFKERSDALVRCYEGSFTGSQEGTWNLIVKGVQLQGLVRNGNTTTLATGLVNPDQSIFGEVSSGATFDGKIVRDKVFGTWKNETGNIVENGNWEGVRTY
ncbi:MAG: hypothetical protein J7578_08910 [Chitinophagaceae bacterium]|nr:hypothetical protein [Chitinophagaceae bacterium]